MEQNLNNQKRDVDLSDQIQGWGADLDHANRPAYPKERIPARDIGVHWTEPEQQAQTVEILHSIERPAITPVFGTTVPPKWISGRIREVAFNLSENDVRHWLLLLLADRVNVAEGVVEDLLDGHIPNLIEETGMRSEWKYNRDNVVRKTTAFAVGVGIAGLAVAGLYKLYKTNDGDQESTRPDYKGAAAMKRMLRSRTSTAKAELH